MRRTLLAFVAACSSAPDDIQVTLTPDLISSLDGTTNVHAVVTAGTAVLPDEAVHVDVTYTDRNGTTHDVPPLDGKTDARGEFIGALTGLSFDGVGTATVTAGSVMKEASFSVLDRTPPKITILPPAANNAVGPGLPLDVQVHVTDEIGVSNVTLDIGSLGGETTSISPVGMLDSTLTFHTAVPADAAPGPSIELHAIAQDLSGNIGVADALTLTVDPNITIATAPGLTGTLLVDGTQNQIASPRSIVFSPMDNHLYVADVAQGGACQPSCIWRVDPGTGAIDATPVHVGSGSIEGLALDATGANLVFSDRQNRVVQMTWNGTAYANPIACNNVQTQTPQDPFHLVVDATLGILVVDGQGEVDQVATCAATTQGTAFTTNANFDQPRGIAAGVAGEFYVSDENRGRVSKMTNTGALTAFENGIGGPYGMRWLAGGTTAFADSLMVAANGDRVIASTKGAGPTSAAFVRTGPIDLTFDATRTMYFVTSPGANVRGRIYKVTGF